MDKPLSTESNSWFKKTYSERLAHATITFVQRLVNDLGQYLQVKRGEITDTVVEGMASGNLIELNLAQERCAKQFIPESNESTLSQMARVYETNNGQKMTV